MQVNPTISIDSADIQRVRECAAYGTIDQLNDVLTEMVGNAFIIGGRLGRLMVDVEENDLFSRVEGSSLPRSVADFFKGNSFPSQISMTNEVAVNLDDILQTVHETVAEAIRRQVNGTNLFHRPPDGYVYTFKAKHGPGHRYGLTTSLQGYDAIARRPMWLGPKEKL